MINDQLAAQLTVEGAQASGHQCREITLHYPLFQLDRIRGRLDNVEQTGAGEISHFALVVNVVHEKIEEREVLLLCLSSEFLSLILGFILLARLVLMGLEPCWQYVWLQTDLGSDVEGNLHHPDFGFGAQSNTVGACDADQKVGQARREGFIFDESLLFALDQGCEEGNGLLDNPFIV